VFPTSTVPIRSVLLTARSASNYASTHANSELVFASADAVLAVALNLYLRALWNR